MEYSCTRTRTYRLPPYHITQLLDHFRTRTIPGSATPHARTSLY